MMMSCEANGSGQTGIEHQLTIFDVALFLKYQHLLEPVVGKLYSSFSGLKKNIISYKNYLQIDSS